MMVGPCAVAVAGLEPFNASALAGEPIATSEGDPRAEQVLERVDSFRPLLAGKLVDKGGARYDRSGVAVRRRVDPRRRVEQAPGGWRVVHRWLLDQHGAVTAVERLAVTTPRPPQR